MENLLSFLMKAKKKTYASLLSRPIKTKEGGNKYISEENDFRYVDIYHGEKQFFGKEIVLKKDKAVWSMVYGGGIVENDSNNKGCYRFLKSCLKKMPKDFPVRGPKTFSKGNYKYINSWGGNFRRFKGVEKIYYKNKLVYSLVYSGGIV